jgi:hypothetical protein
MNLYILKNDTLDKELTKHDNLTNAREHLEHMKKTLPKYTFNVYKATTITTLNKLEVL